MMDRPYTRTGKQILHDGRHFADGDTEDAAQAIVDAMNVPAWLYEQASKTRSRATARAWRVAADNIRAGMHGGEEA